MLVSPPVTTLPLPDPSRATKPGDWCGTPVPGQPPVTTLPLPGEPKNPIDPVRPPLGVSTYGDLNVHYYLNGTITKTFQLHGPLTRPYEIKAASIDDAVAAARHVFDVNPPSGIALTQGEQGTWYVHRLNLDPAALELFARPQQGPGYSWDISNTSDSLRALIVGQKVVEVPAPQVDAAP